MSAPSPRAALLADLVRTSTAFVGRFVSGFDDATALHQAPGLPNHVCWCLGHLALTMHRVVEKINGQPPPASDFVLPPEADGRRGSRTRAVFDAESVSFGSRPGADAAQYPTLERSLAVFQSAVDRLASVVQALPDADLDREVAWGVLGLKMPVSALVARMLLHNGFHTGQIADTRRALRFDSAFA